MGAKLIIHLQNPKITLQVETDITVLNPKHNCLLFIYLLTHAQLFVRAQVHLQRA